MPPSLSVIRITAWVVTTRSLTACAGNPKGVVLSHSNVLATIAALQTYVKEVGLDVHEDDSTLSYLTLAHIFGRALEEFALSLGASVGYWSVSHLPPILMFRLSGTDDIALQRILHCACAQHMVVTWTNCQGASMGCWSTSHDRFFASTGLPLLSCTCSFSGTMGAHHSRDGGLSDAKLHPESL